MECFEVLDDSTGPSDSGKTYHCMECAEKIVATPEGLFEVGEGCKCVGECCMNPVKIIQSFDSRTKK
jgi:hypothetical protein